MFSDTYPAAPHLQTEEIDPGFIRNRDLEKNVRAYSIIPAVERIL
jgi:hypothetical protein